MRSQIGEQQLTKRVISDVLPTLCSPRNTSLNFLSGEDAESSPDAAGAWADIVDAGRRGGVTRPALVRGDVCWRGSCLSSRSLLVIRC